MKRKQFSLLTLLLLALTLSLHAQNKSVSQYTVKGQVVDSLTSETIPYATLRVTSANNPQKPVKLLACDTDGKFEMTLTQPGKYVIAFQSVGKAPMTKLFTLTTNNKLLDLGKIFMNDDSQSLGEVTVTAQKPLVKVDIDKITYNLEDDPEAVTSNALEMLRKVPMVTVDGDDNIQLKGASNFKIYMNGKPSNLITNNPGDVLKSIPASSIKNIEVITDPGSKYDAEGVGGIINIITKSALQGYTGSVRANADNFGSVGGGAYLSAKIGKFGITGNYNYNYRRSPYTNSESFRENKRSDDMKYLTQFGRSKGRGPMQYGYIEASYEIDTLNLISLSANRFDGNRKNISENRNVMEDILKEQIYGYNRSGFSKNNFGGTEINLDYQHSTSLKNELLTVSYKFNNSPNNSEYSTLIENITGNYPLDYKKDWSKNDASTNEHTGQIDYTRPFPHGQTLEAGLKYILRISDSKTERYLDDILLSEKNKDFKHTQNIYSAYASYNLKIKKFGFKAGIRAEGTNEKIKMDDSFKTDYFDIVPSATASYQLNMTQNVRFGYNMRIQRPGIWYLNPYINNNDPLNISYGNKNLDSEKSHNFNLNYGMFSQKFNLNASLNYSFVNNGIERYTFVNKDNPNILESTYDNIGKNQSVGLFLYGSWNPITQLRINVNGGADYQKMTSESYGGNSGFNYRIFSHIQYSLPLDFRISLHGGYFAPRIMLQGKSSSYYFTGLNVSKDFMKKKLTVSLSCSDPFWKTKAQTTITEDDNFYQKSINRYTGRSFRINISWKFGDMKSQIKKIQRGISNDDMKGGNSSGGSEQSM